MSRARYVFDTNTLVSALLFETSTPGRAFGRALRQGDILLSTPTLAELTEVLKRKKFGRYISPEEVETFNCLNMGGFKPPTSVGCLSIEF